MSFSVQVRQSNGVQWRWHGENSFRSRQKGRVGLNNRIEEGAMLKALHTFVMQLSYLPGLDFLRGIASSIYSADRATQQIKRVGESASDLKKKASGKEAEKVETDTKKEAVSNG